ncbi:MAG: hypothetical protein WAN50_02645, partial [Minisyncoccia bacterium]
SISFGQNQKSERRNRSSDSAELPVMQAGKLYSAVSYDMCSVKRNLPQTRFKPKSVTNLKMGMWLPK